MPEEREQKGARVLEEQKCGWSTFQSIGEATEGVEGSSLRDLQSKVRSLDFIANSVGNH